MKQSRDYLKLYANASSSPLDQPKKPRRKQLKGWAYSHASIVADIFCDSTGKRADASEEARALISRAFRELGALVGVPVPPFAYSARTWKQTREAYLEIRRAVRSLCQAEGLRDIPHESELGALDSYTVTGTVAPVAEWLSTLLHRFWCADEFDKPVELQMWTYPTTHSAYREAITELKAALNWAARMERYGPELVRSAVNEEAARREHAITVALAAVPSVDELLRAQGAPDLDSALARELGAEWEKFIADEKGGAG
jgi:hypothetical protein